MVQERLRLFVSLELPEPVREALCRWRAGVLEEEPRLRGVAPEGLHATLCFLGSVAGAEVSGILTALDAARAEPACDLALGAAIWLPRRRPRVLAVELLDPDARLAELQSGLSHALAREIGYAPEKRRFRAHVTVARVRHGSALVPRELEAPDALAFSAESLILYRSHLGGGPARYEEIHRIPLGKSG